MAQQRKRAKQEDTEDALNTTKKCAICDEVFEAADLNAIVRHSAACVHLFSEKNGLDYCKCSSCSTPRKRTRLSEITSTSQTSEDYTFLQAFEQAAKYLSVDKLLKLSTVSRNVFSRVKSILESKFWFKVKGSYNHYQPKNFTVKKVKYFPNVPVSAKQVRFTPKYIFNSPIDDLPDMITHICIGAHFAQKVSHWPPSLIELEVPNADELMIAAIPPTLQKLTMSHQFGHTTPIKIPTLPQSLRSLTVFAPFEFNQFPPSLEHYCSLMASGFEPALPPLPPSLKSLDLGMVNDPIILPPNLEILRTGCNFNQPFSELPASLKKLSVQAAYKQQLPSYPPNLTSMNIFTRFDQALPDSLLHLGAYNFNTELPKLPANLVSLEIRYGSIAPLPPLPLSLQHLSIVSEYTHELLLPPKLVSLEITVGGFNHPLKELPTTLERLSLGDAFTHELSLPSSLKSLQLGKKYNHPFKSLPVGLEDLEVWMNSETTIPPTAFATLSTLTLHMEIAPNYDTSSYEPHELYKVENMISTGPSSIFYVTNTGLEVTVVCELTLPEIKDDEEEDEENEDNVDEDDN